MNKTENTSYISSDLSYNSLSSKNKLDGLFDNLIWMTTKDTAKYLRKTTNAIRIMVYNKTLRPRKFKNRLYFRKQELDELIESSFLREEFNGN